MEAHGVAGNIRRKPNLIIRCLASIFFFHKKLKIPLYLVHVAVRHCDAHSVAPGPDGNAVGEQPSALPPVRQ